MIPPRPQLICFFELLNDCFFQSWPSVPLICDWQWNNVSEVWGSNHWETLNHYCWFRVVQFRDGLCGSVRTLLYFGNSQKLKGCCDSKPSFKSTHLKVQAAYKNPTDTVFASHDQFFKVCLLYHTCLLQQTWAHWKSSTALTFYSLDQVARLSIHGSLLTLDKGPVWTGIISRAAAGSSEREAS